MHAIQDTEPTLAEVFGALPLSIVYARRADLAALQPGARVPLSPPFHVSDDDAYLVVPDDVGLGLVDIFAKADEAALSDVLRTGALVLGVIERDGRATVLEVDEAARLGPMLGQMRYALEQSADDEALDALNALEQAQVTVASELVDEAGLDAMLEHVQHIGPSWRVPAHRKDLAEVDPTHAWSRRLPDGRVGIEMVVFQEYEELVAVLRPAALRPGIRSLRRV